MYEQKHGYTDHPVRRWCRPSQSTLQTTISLFMLLCCNQFWTDWVVCGTLNIDDGPVCTVVFEDTDLKAVADWVMVGIFLCAGQVCSATSRLLGE